MTDKEKYEAVLSYIRGVINGEKYTCWLDVKSFNEFVETLNR